jgi:DNA-binding HxlR family transcriptional regulator
MGIGVLGKRWTLLILRHVAAEGRTSFSELLQAYPRLSRRILSLRLDELRRAGFIEKIDRDPPTRRLAYALSTKGRDAIPLLHTISDFVRRYGEGVSVARGQNVRVEDVCFAHPDIPAVPKSPRLESPPVSSAPVATEPATRTKPMYKARCEKCKIPLAPEAEAYVCSYEYTWCRSCAVGFGWLCPNCQGRLRERRRISSGTARRGI